MAGQAKRATEAERATDSNLHARIAARLVWTEEQARGFSLQALRDLVRPASPKLAAEISSAIASGEVCR